MQHNILIVPGLNGSGPTHWQTWLEGRLPEATRVAGIDWESPVLSRWAGAVRKEIDRLPGDVWIVAHSFGCLASVVAAADRPERVAGALLVAPADPECFSLFGLRSEGEERAAASVVTNAEASIVDALPQHPLPFPSLLVASSNDHWLKLMRAAWWAERWGSRLLNLGAAGHINVDSGFGPWPQVLTLLRSLQAAQASLPLGSVSGPRPPRRGRGGALARLLQRTRGDWRLADRSADRR